MKISTAFQLFAAGAAATSVIKYDLHRRDTSGTADGALSMNNGWLACGGYFMTLEVGTPPQTLEVLVDTGSSDFWIPSADTESCKLGHCPSGQFQPRDSSTYSQPSNTPAFGTTYDDGSSESGHYGVDTVRIGDCALEDHTFGLASQFNDTYGFVKASGGQGTPLYGVMGLRTAAHQSGTSKGFSPPTIPLALKQQGYIGSQSFSLYLDDVSEASHVIFGGVDRAKYQGELKTLGVIENDLDDYLLYATGFTLSHKGKNTPFTTPGLKIQTLFDSGDTTFNVPEALYGRILDMLPCVYGEGLSYSPLAPCAYRDEDLSIMTQLTGTNGVTAEIEVPLKNMLVPALTYQKTGNYNDTDPLVINGTAQCLLMVEPASEKEGVFGVPFLRSAYTFFNMDKSTMSLAQAFYDHGDRSDIVPIGSGDSESYPRGSGNKELMGRAFKA